jgi:murein DD-endopeptidase MepM/ murein hydrolase activator NlpD
MSVGRFRVARSSVGLLLFLAWSLPAQAHYPEIERLDRSDPLYTQHQHDVQDYYRLASAGGELPPLLIYRYEPEEGDTLFAVAARLSLPYSAVATLNRLSSPTLPEEGSILIPGIPGLFVPISPESDLEAVMHDLRSDRDADVVTVPVGEEPTVYRFFPGEDFLPEERTAFLGVFFRHPLPDARLSSPYGPRRNPVTTEWSFHGGADYAAAEGTPVLAARQGRVSRIGDDPVLGTYVIVEHSGRFETLYGHLRSVAVSLNDEVRSGMILGTVGSTGMVTGAHLHFEIRRNGRSRDPERVLP